MKHYRAKRVDLNTYHPMWYDTDESALNWKRCIDENGQNLSFSSIQEARAYTAKKEEEEKGIQPLMQETQNSTHFAG